MKINDEHVLPCDFVVGHIRFGKGVKLETVRNASERWLRIAVNGFTPNLEKMKELNQMLGEIASENPPDTEPGYCACGCHASDQCETCVRLRDTHPHR